MLHQFDPRGFGRRRRRLAPHLLIGAAGVAALVVGWRVGADGLQVAPKAAPLEPAQIAALQHQAFAAAEAQPGLAPGKSLMIKVSRGETFESAVLRAGVAADEAQEVVNTLAKAVTFNIFDDLKAGQTLQVAVAAPRDERGPVKLIGLSMKTGPASTLTLSRSFDGALRMRELEEQVRDETKVACGEINGSLNESARRAGATPSQIHQVVELFAHKIDFSRDIQPGDRFCLVFDRKVTESGTTIEGGQLRYAELEADHMRGGPVKFYRHMAPGATKAQYFDETGKNIKGFLLRTPVDGARMTSRFGMRRHPILGYNRMHQGIDFGAGTGTPVYAAGDGVVVEAGRNGGYGNWVRIRHSGGWDTGYAHLSRFAKGLKRGQRVSQGQLIAYVGSTGRSTGPHLHYEVMKNGRKVDPKGAKVPSGTILGGGELASFKAEKAKIDAMLGGAAQTIQQAEAKPTQVAAR